MKKYIIVPVIVFLVIFCLKDVTAQTYKYTVANGNWTSPSVWNNGSVPPSGADITIQHNITYNNSGNFTASSLEIGPGVTLTLNYSNLTVNNLYLNGGTLANSAHNITISDGGLLCIYDGGSIASTPAGISYDLEYNNALPRNTGPELQNNSVIRDLIINSTDNITLTSNAAVNRNFILLGGNLNISSNTLILKGDIQTGVFFGSLTGGSTSNLTLGCLGSVTLPDIISGQLNTLTIDRTANDIITLGGNLQITNVLNINNGNINTGAYNLTLGTSGANPGTLIYPNSGIITGKFTRWFSASTNAQPVKFPVGVTPFSKSRMVTVQFTSAPTTAGTLTAQYITGDPGYLNNPLLSDSGGTYPINSLGTVGYWQMTATTLAGGTYTITINPSGFPGIMMCDRLRVLKRSSSGTPWTLSGGHVIGLSTPDTTARRQGLSGFSQFALAGNSSDNPLEGPLPIELASFSYSVSSNNVKLTWITETEVNNRGFEIYRKSEQTDWTMIGFINGSGTINTQKTYYYSDNSLSTGKYFYKLKQIDYNGNYEYFTMSGIAEIGTPNKFVVSQNYPNPFNPTTKIDYSIPQNAYVTLKVFDITGKEVAVLVNSQLIAGYYTVNFNADSYHLSSGIYFYTISAGNNTEIKKFTLIK